MTTCIASTVSHYSKQSQCGGTCPDVDFHKSAVHKNQAKAESSQSVPLLNYVPDGISRKVWELVNAMHQDQVTNIVKEERCILKSVCMPRMDMTLPNMSTSDKK